MYARTVLTNLISKQQFPVFPILRDCGEKRSRIAFSFSDWISWVAETMKVVPDMNDVMYMKVVPDMKYVLYMNDASDMNDVN